MNPNCKVREHPKIQGSNRTKLENRLQRTRSRSQIQGILLHHDRVSKTVNEKSKSAKSHCQGFMPPALQLSINPAYSFSSNEHLCQLLPSLGLVKLLHLLLDPIRNLAGAHHLPRSPSLSSAFFLLCLVTLPSLPLSALGSALMHEGEESILSLEISFSLLLHLLFLFFPLLSSLCFS